MKTFAQASILPVAIAVVGWLVLSFSTPALAVEPGVNCDTYDGDVCVIPVGDIWFCTAEFQDGVCPTSTAAGDTVRWEYPAGGELIHTITACGDDCDAPTDAPLWDSGLISPGDSFEFTLTEPGQYLYYCEIHPTAQRGLIRVLDETPPGEVGDANCNGDVNAIDATLILQFVAGLLGELSCEENADANASGDVNAIDSTLILQFVAGFIDQLPP